MTFVRDYPLESPSLQETRMITVFLPDQYRPTAGLPVLFCADGQAVPWFSGPLSYAIQRQEAPPVILIGVHSDPAYRAREYLDGMDAERFSAHERFFAEEVYLWAVSEFHLSLDRSRCGVFGFSNGGGFALTMGVRHREKYGVVIAFSIAGDPRRVRESEYTRRPIARYYLSAGTREIPFLKTVRAVARLLEKHGVEHILTQREAGHDFHFWNSELCEAVSWAFARDKSTWLTRITKACLKRIRNAWLGQSNQH
jgi:enterochelin esterase-like enzyme